MALDNIARQGHRTGMLVNRKQKKLVRQELGAQFSEAAREMWMFMEAREFGVSDMAEFVGANKGMVSRWLYGDTVPGRAWALSLMVQLGLPVGLWDKPPKKGFILPAARGKRA